MTETHLCPDVLHPESIFFSLGSRPSCRWKVVISFSVVDPSAALDSTVVGCEAASFVLIKDANIPQRALELQEAWVWVCVFKRWRVLLRCLIIAAVLQIGSPDVPLASERSSPSVWINGVAPGWLTFPGLHCLLYTVCTLAYNWEKSGPKIGPWRDLSFKEELESLLTVRDGMVQARRRTVAFLSRSL